jgi:hypothetical protein
MWIGVLKILSSFVDGRIIVVDQWEARSLTGTELTGGYQTGIGMDWMGIKLA